MPSQAKANNARGGWTRPTSLRGYPVNGVWMYLYRAVDSTGATVEFMLSQTRNAVSAKRFFRRALSAKHTVTPRIINVDRNPSYPKAVSKIRKKGILPPECELRPVKYLNNLI